MKDKTDQIVKASISVFIKKGYIASTTKEIAKKANVAEVTLYRKFGTKQNLFEYSVKSITVDKFNSVLDFNDNMATLDFFQELLDNRLLIISKNLNLVRMLVSESISGNLPKDLRFTNIVFESVNQLIQQHFKVKNITEDAQAYSKIIGGILLGYAILPNNQNYHTLSKEEQAKYLSNYLNILVKK